MAVGFIGLGVMGKHMARSLLRAGHDLVVNDVMTQSASELLEAGARWGNTPAEVAGNCDVVFTSLPGPSEVEEVSLGTSGIIQSVRPGLVCFDLSTNSVSTVRRVSSAFAERGAKFLDAPVSGGPLGAKDGKLAIWVGGDRVVYDQQKHLLDAIGDAARYVGPIGAGTIAKLVHNCAGYAVNAVMAEVFAMGVKAGVEPLDLWEAVSSGVLGRRTILDLLTAQFIPGRYDPPNFALRLAHKDVSLATALGRELQVPMRFANLTLEEMTEALNRGWGDRDSRVFMLLELERAGVQIAVPQEQLKAALSARK